MRNKNVGYMIIGISIVIGLIIFLFNTGMTDIVNDSCSHGPSCSMYGTIKTQTYLSAILSLAIFGIGLFFVLSKEEKEIIYKKLDNKIKVDYSKLDKEEKKVMFELKENNGSLFQADLSEKTGFSKVKITRILDRLEGKQFIERKRRGMTNIVLIKN